MGCANPANNSNGDDEKKPVDTTELKMALYNKILGTWELKEGDESDSGYETIIFSSNSITFNGEKKSFDPNTNLFFNSNQRQQLLNFLNKQRTYSN